MKSLKDFVYEYELNKEHCHHIFEMALISDKNDQLPNNTQIQIYNEKDTQGTKTPHFHILIDNKFEFMIAFDHFHDLEIWRSKTAKHDWSGYKNVKKAIRRWLDQFNFRNNKIKNIDAILNTWNDQNTSNKVNVDKYKNLYKKLKND